LRLSRGAIERRKGDADEKKRKKEIYETGGQKERAVA